MKYKMISRVIYRFVGFVVSVVLLGTAFISDAQAMSIYNLEQQINIINGEFSTESGTDSPTDNSLGLANYSSGSYTGPQVYFEVVAKCVDCTGGNARVKAGLYNQAGSLQSTLVSTSGTYVRLRSSSLTLADGNYTVRFSRDATAGTAYVKAARLVVIQGSPGGLTDTEAQIELGSFANTISTSPTTLSAPKIYLYDSSQYSGTVEAYFEATIKTTDNLSSATYEYNNYDSGGLEWATNPENMASGSTATFASTNLNGDTQTLTANTNTGSNLGTITKVEIRAYAYQSTDTTGSVSLRPVFDGSDAGDNHNFVPGTSAEWSTYADITTDSNAPQTWTWSDVEDLDVNVIWNANSGSNTGYVALVDVRVTYESSSVSATAELYNLTAGEVVANGSVSSSSNSFTLVRGSAPLSTYFDTLSQYQVRIHTNSSSNTAYLSNAKIILVQSQESGIQQTETVQHHLTSLRTQTNTLYTQESFLNQFDPTNFAGGNSVEAYFEAVMRTTGETAYAMLYNVSDSEVIGSPITSEVTTTATSWTRRRSSNLISNTDWPTAAKTLDTIIKASEDQTASYASSWLIIRVGAVDPRVTFTIEGVGEAETHNGVTTSVTSTVTSLPFGNISVGVPVFTAHKLTISVNQAPSAYTVDVKLNNFLQGQYPANHIDPFVGSSATWELPKEWSTPTGTTANVDSGWIGVGTDDTEVAGWNTPTGLFGPLSETSVEVGRSVAGESKTIYVIYGFEVNANQPADTYAGSLIYNFLPKY